MNVEFQVVKFENINTPTQVTYVYLFLRCPAPLQIIPTVLCFIKWA